MFISLFAKVADATEAKKFWVIFAVAYPDVWATN
jgi:hypothetical protein